MLLVERLSDAGRTATAVLAVIRGTRGQPGRRVQRPDRAQRPVPAAGDPAGAGQRPAGARRTSTRSRRTAPARRSATRSRRRRCWPPTGRTAPGPPLWLGSLKSNIGHTQAAAGRRRRHQDGAWRCGTALLPQTLHVDEPTPHVDWSRRRGRLLTEARPWPETDRPRRAARLVVRHERHQRPRHPRSSRRPADRRPPRRSGRRAGAGVFALPLSGADAGTALAGQAARLLPALAGRAGRRLADVGCSLATTRAALAHRAVVVGADREQLARRSGRARRRRPASRVVTGAVAPAPVAFLFTGQGAQRAGMGRELYAASPVFAAAFDECCAALDLQLDRPLADVLADERAARPDRVRAAGAVRGGGGAARAGAAWGVTPDVWSATRSARSPPPMSPGCCRWRTPRRWSRRAAG